LVNNNGHLKTVNLIQAQFLIVHNVKFIGVERLNPQQWEFIFETPPDAVLAEWTSGQDQVSLRAAMEAREFLLDRLTEARRNER
jgi:hypothetical protein